MAASINITARSVKQVDPSWYTLGVAPTPVITPQKVKSVDPSWYTLGVAPTPDIAARPTKAVDPSWYTLGVAPEPDIQPRNLRSTPFIDTLDPVLVGSEWRKKVLEATKIETTATLPVLSPAPSDSVSASSTIFIPCGDRIPEIKAVRLDGTSPATTPGLVNERTIIQVNGTVVYSNGSQQNGWTVTSTANDIKGFNYELTGPGGILPISTNTVDVYIEGSRGFADTYSFTAQEGDPPYLQNEDPEDLDTGVLKDKVLTFEVVDDISGVDLTTVMVYVEGNLAYNGSTDTFNAPYDGGSSAHSVVTGPPSGYHFDIQKTSDWDSYSSVSVRVVAEDSAANELDTTYSFTIEDWAGPTFANNSPTGTGVSKSTSVSVDINDVGGVGVDNTTIDVDIDSTNAVIDGVFQAGFSGTIVANGSNGYTVTVDKDTDYDSLDTISVDVYAEDLSANSGTFNWSFEIEDYLGPLVGPTSPTQDQTGVALDSNIEFTLIDESGTVLSTLVIEVDITGTGTSYETAYTGEAFQSGWDGPESAIVIPESTKLIQVTIDPVLNLPADTLIYVRVTAQDLFGNDERLP
jgi:hypothetical protein